MLDEFTCRELERPIEATRWDRKMPATLKDQMSYIVLCASRDGGTCVAERDIADLDFKTTVADIATGQIEDMVQVIECNPVEGTCLDVTEEAALAVVSYWADENEPLTRWKYDFVEQYAGVRTAIRFARAA